MSGRRNIQHRHGGVDAVALMNARVGRLGPRADDSEEDEDDEEESAGDDRGNMTASDDEDDELDGGRKMPARQQGSRVTGNRAASSVASNAASNAVSNDASHTAPTRHVEVRRHVSSVASRESTIERNSMGNAIDPEERDRPNMYMYDRPHAYERDRCPNMDMLASIRETVKRVLFPKCKFYRDDNDADSVTGLTLKRLGFKGNGYEVRLNRARLWSVVRATIFSLTKDERQATIEKWYRVANGKYEKVCLGFRRLKHCC